MNSNTRAIRPAKLKLGVFSAALFVCMAVASACDAPKVSAGLSNNSTQVFFVHALSGSPLASSTAILFAARSVTRVDGTFGFDVAFDIDSKGFVTLLTPQLVGQNPAGNKVVGIITNIGLYNDITEAPFSGYTLDSAVTVRAGQAVVVQSQEPLCASTNPTVPYLYAKIVVDSVDYRGRGIYGRALITGDCGYRSLIPGFPAF